MKAKLLLLTVCLALLLCACQGPADTETPAANLPPETGEVEPAVPDTPPEDPAPALPSAPPVCQVPFTETESFPLPFDEELLVDEEKGLLLSAGQALYDYDTMWTLLEENFPYFAAIEKDLGVSSQEVKARHRAELVSETEDGYITQRAFLQRIDACLKEFYSVGHLFVISPNRRQILFDVFQNIDNPVGQKILELASSKKAETWYTHWENMPQELPKEPLKEASSESSSANRPTVIVNPFATPKAAITRNIDLDTGVRAGYVEDIPYLSIPTFGGWTEDTYEGIAAFLNENSGQDHLIIDICGNGGGDTLAWTQGIVAPLITEELTYNMLLGAKTGALNLAMVPFLNNPEEAFHVYRDDSWKKDFPLIVDGSFQEVDLLLRSTSSISPSNSTHATFKKIWVLIDQGNYSAADNFAYFCKETGFATLVGTTTRGNGIGFQPAAMALPYSGLMIYYEQYLSYNPDGTCNGTRGTLPDIAASPGQTPLQACWQAIQSE